MNQAAPHHAKEARSIHFAEVLMARESITPKDAGCQSYLIYRLQKLGFSCTKHKVNGVTNLIARWGHGPLHFAFSGHTDVVPASAKEWSSDPFVATQRNNKVYGRGSTDMKGFIACSLALAPYFSTQNLEMQTKLRALRSSPTALQ
mgnify:CR=1 FL=1